MPASPRRPGSHRRPWGRLDDGRQVALWTLVGADGARARVTPWGAALVQLEVPDGRDGRLHPTMVELPDAAAYVANPAYVGAVVGRYANRIAGGRFELDGGVVEVERTGPHHLHGGPTGRFSHRLWESVPEDGGAPGVSFHLRSPAGEGGFPGNVEARVRYRLVAGALLVEFRAVTDAPTHLSLTHHPYLTLASLDSDSVADHRLTIHADRYLPTDGDAMVTGKVAPVEGTPFDLRAPRPLGECWNAEHPQVRAAGGFDHCWLLGGAPPPAPAPLPTGASPPGPRGTPAHGGLPLRPAATLEDPGSGRALHLDTTLPALQCFTPGAMADVVVRSPDGSSRPFPPRSAVALECQFPPDAPNQPHFPSTRLDPGEVWAHAIRYRWG